MGKKGIVLIFILVVSLVSCINHSNEDDEIGYWKPIEFENTTEELLAYMPKYAQGYRIEPIATGIIIGTKNIKGNEKWRDEVFLPFTEDHELPKHDKILSYPLENISCQSSTYLPFIDFLGHLNNVKGVCGLQYVQNDLADKLKSNKTEEICVGESTESEKILGLDPDLYFVYPFESEETQNLESKGVNTFMMGEYLEKHPLARLEWIKVFGLLLGEFEMANKYFERIEMEYLTNRVRNEDADHAFIMNVPYGESWDLPSPNSLIVTLCHDAGLNYHFQDEQGTENMIRSKEEMWEIGNQVPYWVIIADRPAEFTLEDLKAEEEVYSTFASVKEGKVIFCNTGTSDYFTYGVIEPHIMLEELSKAVDGLVVQDAKYFKILN